MTPQIIYLSIAFIGLLYSAHKHGTPKDGKNNFWIQLFATIIGLVILYFGGFFNPIL